MIAELVRLVHLALTDGTTGVNAQIDALALDGPAAGGSDTRPAHVTVRNVVDHDCGIQAADETQFPLLIVRMGQEGKAGFVWTNVRDSDFPIEIAYFTKSGTVQANMLAADYTYRAIFRALEAGMFSASAIRKSRNGFVVSKYSGIDVLAPGQVEQSDVLAGLFTIHLTVRETSP